jgi:transposase, IS30 family
MSIKYSHLSLDERVKIEILLDHGASLAGAARVVGRHRSTVCRELKRSRRDGQRRYIAHLGHSAYALLRKLAGRGRRKFGCDLSCPIWLNVLADLRHGLSPEQYAGRMRLLDALHLPPHLHSPVYASHTTIYRAIHDLPYSPDRAELTRLLRRSTGGRRFRRSSGRFTSLQNITSVDQ